MYPGAAYRQADAGSRKEVEHLKFVFVSTHFIRSGDIRASDFASVEEMSSGDVLTLSADNSAALPRLRIKFHPAAMPATGPAL